MIVKSRNAPIEADVIAVNRSGVALPGTVTTNSREGKSVTYGGGREGGILTPAYSLSYHLFSNMHENRINIGDIYDLAYFNCFHCLIRLGSNSDQNRHQRHQATQWML